MSVDAINTTSMVTAHDMPLEYVQESQVVMIFVVAAAAIVVLVIVVGSVTGTAA